MPRQTLHSGRGRASTRDQYRHAAPLGSGRAHPRRARCGEPPCRRCRRVRAPGRRSWLGAPVGAQPFRGVISSVEVDGLLARVEIDVTEPARWSRSSPASPSKSWVEAGDERRRGGQVDHGDGRALRRSLARRRDGSACRRTRRPASRRLRARPGRRTGRATVLRGGVAHRRCCRRWTPAHARPLRRFEPAGPQPGSAGLSVRRLPVRQPAKYTQALYAEGLVRQAGPVRDEQPRPRSLPKGNPARISARRRPRPAAEAARWSLQARRCQSASIRARC